LRICQENNLKIVNTWFRKRAEHLITYRSGHVASQIDYILLRQNEAVKVKNCKVIPGEECIMQHRLVLTEKLKVTVGGWERVISAVVETAKEVCGESRGKRHHERTLWWWCEKVQQAINEKKEAYKIWQGERTEDSKRSYREKKSRARREVAVAKRQAWEQWSQNINTAEGKNKMFRIAKQMKKDRKDVV